VRQQGSTAAYEAVATSSYTLVVTAPTPCTGVSMSASPPSPQSLGTAVTWSATNVLGCSTAEYKWYELPAGGTWRIAQDWSPNASVAWSTTTETAGISSWQVWVRQQGSTAAYEAVATSSYTLAPITFGAGTKVVGADIPAGTYRTRIGNGGCYWERLRGFGGTFGEIIANELTDYPSVVMISATDAGFSSSGCATWTSDLSRVTASPTAPFPNGTFIVGVDISAGTWSAVASAGCYWERLAGFSGEFEDIIANQITDGSVVVAISPSDKGFRADRCGNWTKTG
jgi:hypothetical protein